MLMKWLKVVALGVLVEGSSAFVAAAPGWATDPTVPFSPVPTFLYGRRQGRQDCSRIPRAERGVKRSSPFGGRGYRARRRNGGASWRSTCGGPLCDESVEDVFAIGQRDAGDDLTSEVGERGLRAGRRSDLGFAHAFG